MRTEEEESEKEPQEKVRIERVPEPMFGGTRERLSVVTEEEQAPEDTGDQEKGKN